MRRILTILLLVAALSVLARGAFPCDVVPAQPTCYAALQPGPVEDALGLTLLPGAQTYASTGSLLLTTVAVDGDLDLRDWIEGAISPRIQHVPRGTIFPEDKDREQVRQENAALMQGSQLEAALAALRHLGYDFDEEFDGAEVVEIVEPSAVQGDELRVGDLIVAVDGTATPDNRAVGDAVRSHAPGDVVTLGVVRDGRERAVELELISNPDDPEVAHIGVVLMSHLELPVDVRIDAGVIGGPSAGLVFALSIVDLLGPDDLTGGAVIAATGTIDAEGHVGAVGGIVQKVLGATSPEGGRTGATAFLVPRGNLDEARGAPVDGQVLLVPIDTLDDAVAALTDLREGRQPADAYALGAP